MKLAAAARGRQEAAFKQLLKEKYALLSTVCTIDGQVHCRCPFSLSLYGRLVLGEEEVSEYMGAIQVRFNRIRIDGGAFLGAFPL